MEQDIRRLEAMRSFDATHHFLKMSHLPQGT